MLQKLPERIILCKIDCTAPVSRFSAMKEQRWFLYQILSLKEQHDSAHSDDYDTFAGDVLSLLDQKKPGLI